VTSRGRRPPAAVWPRATTDTVARMTLLAIKPQQLGQYMQLVPEIVARSINGGGSWSRSVDAPGDIWPIKCTGESDGASFRVKIDGPGLYEDDFVITGALDDTSWRASIDTPGIISPTWKASGSQASSGWTTLIEPPGYSQPSQRESGSGTAPTFPGSGPANMFSAFSSALSQAITSAIATS
jgi:hypothetical protein